MEKHSANDGSKNHGDAKIQNKIDENTKRGPESTLNKVNSPVLSRYLKSLEDHFLEKGN